MKRFFVLALGALFSLTVLADHEMYIPFEQAPEPVQQYVKQHFNPADVRIVEVEDGYDYEIHFVNGVKLDLHSNGTLDKIDMGYSGAPIPAGIVPQAILDYVAATYPNFAIKEYDPDMYKQSVELTNGLELIFDPSGRLLGYDD